MKKLAIVALMFLSGAIHAGERYVPVMRPSAPVCAPCGTACQCSPSCPCPAPAVFVPSQGAEVRPDAGGLRIGSQAADAPAIVALAVGQCPGGVCPVPQRSQAVAYSVPTMAQPVYTGNYSDIPKSSPQPVYTFAERPRLFSRMFAADRPRLFGRLFTGKLFAGGASAQQNYPAFAPSPQPLAVPAFTPMEFAALPPTAKVEESLEYRWVPSTKPEGGVLTNWMAGDHLLYRGDTYAGQLRGNGWYFSAPDDLMAEPPIPRPQGIRTPVAGEMHPEKNGYGTRWQIGRKINPPPLPGQPGYENFGYQMAAAAPVSGPVAGDTSLEAAQRMAGVPVGAAPSYSVGVLDRRNGTTTQVPVYHLKSDGTVDYNVQPCNRPLRPNPTEVSVPLGNASVPVGRTVSTHFANVSLDHTHTCPKCGYTWDHAEDGGSHNCPKCGTHQTIGAFKSANTPSRLRGQPVVGYPPTTGIFRPVTGAMSGGCDNGQCGTSAPAFSGGAFSWPASGGCANGQCQAPQSGRRR